MHRFLLDFLRCWWRAWSGEAWGQSVTTCCSAFLGNNHFSSQNSGCLSQLHSLNHSCYHGRDTQEPRAGLDLHPPRQGTCSSLSPRLHPSLSIFEVLSLALCSNFGQILVEFMVELNRTRSDFSLCSQRFL